MTDATPPRYAPEVLPLTFLLACDDMGPTELPPPQPKPAWTDAERAAAIEAGTAVLDKHECRRCHELDALPDPPRPDHCTSCHLWLDGLKPGSKHYVRISDKYGEPLLVRYQTNIRHLKEIPSLTQVGNRLHPGWIDAYLQAPYDLRPALEESMIRTNLTADERQTVVRYFAAVVGKDDPYRAGMLPPEPPAADPAPGEALFKSKGCGACHTVGNRPTGMTAAALIGSPPAKLAPNLRFVKDRMDRDTLVRWIVDPQSVWEQASMPAFGVTEDEAGLIADFLLHADPMLEPTPVVDAKLPPVLDREVGWAEVKEEVLGDVCVHCHMNDHEKDTGPGNGGGLGYDGVGLKMRTYESLVSGTVLDGALIESMRVRKIEALRDQVAPFADHDRPAYPEALGMPMGLPARTDHEIALVRTWIEQGCPGPTEVTGLPGADDGFLVPDGPIPVNHGCQTREPTTPRPPWAVR